MLLITQLDVLKSLDDRDRNSPDPPEFRLHINLRPPVPGLRKTNLKFWCCPWKDFTGFWRKIAAINCSTGSGRVHGKITSERPRVALTTGEYDRLRVLVLERDGWKCQSCGSRTNLQVPHLVYRKPSGCRGIG